jgi:hypothetical protein
VDQHLDWTTEERLEYKVKELETQIARIKAADRSDRREWVLYGVAIVGAVLVLLAIVGGVVVATHEDRTNRTRLAHECIAAGNIWTNGSCLIAHKVS